MKKIVIPISPHWGQRQILEHPSRWKVIDCGRRWGKSVLGLIFVLEECVKKFELEKRKIRGWVIAPTFPLVRENWLMAEELWKDIITKKNKAEMSLELLGLFNIDFKSAERHDEGLRGAGLDVALLDECARISHRSWLAGIRPALSDHRGVAMFISTPKGQNWFYNMFLRGQTVFDGCKSWKFQSKDNPYFSVEEWMEAKKELPEHVFRQEFAADFLEDEALVFRGVDKIKSMWRQDDKQAQTGHKYIIGVDLARTVDFTVLTVFDVYKKKVIDFDRFQDVSWTLQKQRINNLAKKYNNAAVVLDSTGVGDPIYEDLSRFGLNITPIKFTNENKSQMIEKLVLAIEQKLIGIPDEPQLITELKAFTYTLTADRRIKYNAPDGMHDDCVISLALAVWDADIYRQYVPKVDSGSQYRRYETERPAMAG